MAFVRVAYGASDSVGSSVLSSENISNILEFLLQPCPSIMSAKRLRYYRAQKKYVIFNKVSLWGALTDTITRRTQIR